MVTSCGICRKSVATVTCITIRESDLFWWSRHLFRLVLPGLHVLFVFLGVLAISPVSYLCSVLLSAVFGCCRVTLLRSPLVFTPGIFVRDQFGGFLRAELSSNGPPIFALTRMSIVLFCLFLCGICWPILAPLRRSGRTRTSSLSSTTSPSGRQGFKRGLRLDPPLRPRGRTGVFRRREGHLLASPSRASPSASPSCSFASG